MPSSMDRRPSLLPNMYLPLPDVSPARQFLFKAAWPIARRISRFMGVDHSYATGETYEDPHIERGCLDGAGIAWRIVRGSTSQIPAKGPVIVISNHAYGMADGLIQALLIGTVRPDYMQIVNEMLDVFPKLATRYIMVNAFDSGAARQQNTAPLREALKWLKGGHAVGAFPAGVVSHRTWANPEVTDTPWNPSILMLAKRSKATIVPMYFHGHNGRIFQWAGLLSAKLRTMLIPRSYVAARGKCIDIAIGEPITADALERLGDREETLAQLREKVYMLQADASNEPETAPLASHTERSGKQFEREIAALPPEDHFGDSGKFSVYISRPEHIPGILKEIGRLREITFRAAGEGTGNDLDLDAYDGYYRHLFIWNKRDGEVVGAYRLGLTDEILPAKGIDGCYTRSLFQYEESMLDDLGPSIELGRSFIRPEYQRGFKPLMLLWRGISNFAARHRRYRHAFGVVSISNEYCDQSRHLMTAFLERTQRLPEYANRVQARTPYTPDPADNIDELLASCATIEDVDECVRKLEPNDVGAPVLVRQYLKLEAKLLAPFNVDHDFADVIDGLMLVDFMKVERRIAHFYLGKELATAFREYHGFDAFDESDESDHGESPEA